MKRRYERLQFWMEDIFGDWISMPLRDIAPSDIERAKLGKTEYLRSIIGVGVRQRGNRTIIWVGHGPKVEHSGILVEIVERQAKEMMKAYVKLRVRPTNL